MNMFWHELQAYRKSTLIWTFSLAALVILLLSMFPTFANNAAEVRKLLEGYPEGLLKALDLSLDNISSLLGYYPFVFAYVLLGGAIQAMNLGLSLLSKEARLKTADFLLTKPVTRRQVLTAKLTAAVISLVFTNVSYLAVSSLMASVVSPESYSIKIFLLISVTLFFVQLIFMSLGILISALIPQLKSVISVSLGTVFAFFIISMLDSSLGEATVRYLSPFEYFDSTYIIQNATYETSYLLLTFAIVLVSITLSYVVYSRRDIRA